VFGWRVLEQAVEDGGAVEPAHHRQPPPDGGGLELADFLHPPHVQLNVRPLGLQWTQLPLRTPGQEHATVGLGVLARDAFEPGQVGRDGQPKHIRLFGHQVAKTDRCHDATAHDPVSATCHRE